MAIRLNTKNCPTLNNSLIHLKGEIWIDIPDYEGLYELSNFGRVKSVGRWIDRGTYDYFKPERILKPQVTWFKRKKRPAKLDVSLQIKLFKHKKRYYYSIARLVYNSFVSPFNLEDHTVIVTRKNGNILDCFYKNLKLKSISDVAKTGFKTGKRKSHFQLQVKPVTQHNTDGEIMKEYKTVKEASEATGIRSNYINDAARTKDRMAGGYYWRYGDSKPIIRIPKANRQRDYPENTGNKTHHYLNRNLQNLPGEIWKPVKNFEELYEVSNYGRIKSLRRLKKVVTLKNNITKFWTKEFIMKQTLAKVTNKYSSIEPMLNLTLRLKKGNAYTAFLVSRLVFDTYRSDKNPGQKTRIMHKDGDHLNNHIDNLEPGTQSDVIKKSYEDGRRQSHFAGLSEKTRAKYVLQTAKKNSRPVTQYNEQGKRVKIFESTVAAAKATGITESSINNAQSGRYLMAGGYVWRRGSGKMQIDVSSVQEKLKKRFQKTSTPVSQLSADGKRINSYPSFTEAAMAVGGSAKQISHAARGISKTAYGYKWKILIPR